MTTPEVTRSMEATTPATSAAVDRARRTFPNGWWGMLLVICTEATFFGVLISTYFYLRFQHTAWPPPGVEKPKVALPLILTGVLVAATVPLIAAVRAGRNGHRGRAWWLLLVAVLIQGAYLGIQIHEFVSELDKVDPKATAYGSIYFTLIGAHHFHVAVGIVLELWLLGALMFGLTNYRLVGLRAVALYWYFVTVAAIAVVFTQVSPSL